MIREMNENFYCLQLTEFFSLMSDHVVKYLDEISQQNGPLSNDHLKVVKSHMVKFTNILRAAFCQFAFSQNTNTKYKYRKATQNTFVQKVAQKMLVKLTPTYASYVQILDIVYLYF